MRFIMFGLIVLFPVMAAANTISVPSDAPTIQDAISLSSDGDTILIADGLYYGEGNEGIECQGKAIHIRSETGPQSCLLYGSEDRLAFHIHQGEIDTTIIEGLTILGFRALDGEGGAVVCNQTSPRIINCRFLDNITSTIVNAFGGAILCLGSDALIESCLFERNKAEGGFLGAGYGGAIAARGGQLTVYNCTFINNSCNDGISTGGGGSIFGDNDASIGIYLCTFRSTGGIRVNSGSLVMAYCEITEANASYDTPVNLDASPFLITHCKFNDNFQTTLYANECNVELNATEIIGNIASQRCGGIILQNSTGTVIDCLIANNVSTAPIETTPAGGMYLSGSSLRLANVTVTGNTTNNNSGGIHIVDSEIEIENSILWGNSPDQIQVPSGESPSIRFSVVQGGYAGESVFDLDPLFVEGLWGGYYLSNTDSGQAQDSPCLNAGSSASEEVCFKIIETFQVCLDERSTQTDGNPDVGLVDLGFHFPCTTPPPSPTPTRTSVPTSTARPSSTPTPTATRTPTPTQTPLTTGVTIDMPSSTFHEGDEFYCNAIVAIAGELPLQNHPLFIILDILGSCYFAPSFSEELDDYLAAYPEFPSGLTTIQVIPKFYWPSGVSPMEGIIWYGALTNPEMTQVYGEMDSFSFGWE